MYDFDVCLTNKSRYRRWVNVLEWVALAALGLLLPACVKLLPGMVEDVLARLGAGLTGAAVIAACFAWLIWRRVQRTRARRIAAGFALARNGRLPWEKLAEETGVQDVQKTVDALCRRRYLIKTQPCRGVGAVNDPLTPESVYCVKCGAPLPPGAAGTYRCEYCGHMPGSEML